MNLNYLSIKRLSDILLAIILIILFLPFWLIVPILIKLDSEGPIIFRHRRLGENGKEFFMLKFRSMILGADDILHKKDSKLLKEFKEKDWKLEAKNDPRITQLGRVLRALTIDEFPQLINVLKGEMSMVGPRAYLQQELKDQQRKYPKTKSFLKKALKTKPGITGLWQVSGRNKITFDKRAALDAKYAKEISLWTDLRILLMTPKAMLSKW